MRLGLLLACLLGIGGCTAASSVQPYGNASGSNSYVSGGGGMLFRF